jgi:hypothetical protein
VSKTENFDAEGNLIGTSVTTTPSRWDEDSRVWELAYSDYLAGLCECGVPREVCMDETKAWLVDFKVGYRCRALDRIQWEKSKEDDTAIKQGAHVAPHSRKWTAVEYREGVDDDGQGGESPIPD